MHAGNHDQMQRTCASDKTTDLAGAPCAQVCCYKDSKLLKLFQDIVRILYDNDVIAEDTIMWCVRTVRHFAPWG